MHQLLIPRVQHRKEANAGAKPLRIRCHGQQGFGHGPEQQTVDELRILERNGRQLLRQRKDYVRIRDGQQLF